MISFLRQVKDQQEAEQKKLTSQEIQAALTIQTKEISEKQTSVMEELSKVEPAVRDAQQGNRDKSKIFYHLVQQLKEVHLFLKKSDDSDLPFFLKLKL